MEGIISGLVSWLLDDHIYMHSFHHPHPSILTCAATVQMLVMAVNARGVPRGRRRRRALTRKTAPTTRRGICCVEGCGWGLGKGAFDFVGGLWVRVEWGGGGGG